MHDFWQKKFKSEILNYRTLRKTKTKLNILALVFVEGVC